MYLHESSLHTCFIIYIHEPLYVYVNSYTYITLIFHVFQFLYRHHPSMIFGLHLWFYLHTHTACPRLRLHFRLNDAMDNCWKNLPCPRIQNIMSPFKAFVTLLFYYIMHEIYEFTLTDSTFWLETKRTEWNIISHGNVGNNRRYKCGL